MSKVSGAITLSSLQFLTTTLKLSSCSLYSTFLTTRLNVIHFFRSLCFQRPLCNEKKYLLINTPWIIKQRSSAEFFSTIIIFALTISYLEDSRRELLWAEMKGLLFRSAARKCSQEIPTPPSDRWTISICAKRKWLIAYMFVQKRWHFAGWFKIVFWG